MPGIDLPSGIKTLNPVPVEFWSGPYTGADETAAKLAANTAIPSAVRFLTMEVSLIIAGIGYKYWYKDGIADLDLVKVDTDISNLVTLNTNQTITGEKTFNGGDLKLQGYDNVNAVSLIYYPGVGTGTVVFPDASGGTAKTIAYRDWVTSQGYITSNAVNSVNGQTGVVVLTTTNISEGSNLYYTSTRANNDFDTRLATKTTSDLTEGTNLYYTNTRFNTDFASKTTTDLGEGSNLYFTNARAIGATLTGYTSGAGTISSADSILQAIQKLNGNIAGLVTGVSSFNTRTGAITLTSTDVTDALTFTPYNASNPSNYIPLTALSSSATGLTYNNTTGVFSLTSGYIIPTTTQETDWNTAYTNRITSLTTTGASGAATLSGNALNIPNYTLAGLGGDNASNITSGTLADARLSSNVALKNINNTFSANQTISKTTPTFSLTDANSRSLTATKNETNNNYTLTNNVSEVGGALSNGIKFANVNSYLETNPTNITGLTQWSISFWINYSTGGNGDIVYCTDGTNSFGLYLNSGYIMAKYNGYNIAWYTNTTIPNNQWNNIVVTKSSGGSILFYVNGFLSSSFSGFSNLSSITKLRVGNSSGLPYSSAVAFTTHTLDQLVIYNTILAGGDVTTIYSGGTGTPSLPLTGNIIGRWEFNEGLGNTTIDVSANNNLLTGTNGFTWMISSGKIATAATYQNAFLQRSRDGIYTGNRGENYFGDPFGGTWISGRTLKFTRLDETVASLISGENGNILISPNNTTLSAIPLSPLTVVGNSYFGTNTAATAKVHIAASSTSASGGQLKLTSGGSRQSTPENGTINNVANNLEFVDGGVVYILAKTLKATSTLDFGSTPIPSLGTETLTITLTGVADGDQVALGVPNGSMTAGLIYFAWVSAANTVSIQCYNSTLGAIDPASGTFKISVIKQ